MVLRGQHCIKYNLKNLLLITNFLSRKRKYIDNINKVNEILDTSMINHINEHLHFGICQHI